MASGIKTVATSPFHGNPLLPQNCCHHPITIRILAQQFCGNDFAFGIVYQAILSSGLKCCGNADRCGADWSRGVATGSFHGLYNVGISAARHLHRIVLICIKVFTNVAVAGEARTDQITRFLSHFFGCVRFESGLAHLVTHFYTIWDAYIKKHIPLASVYQMSNTRTSWTWSLTYQKGAQGPQIILAILSPWQRC